MMTIHAAKGLEFKAVFVGGMEENLFPSQLALNSREELEEERRLFYVALTRAEKFLTLSYATSRYKWGKIDLCEPSRFLNEIDQDLLELPPEPAAGNGFFSFEDERSNFGGFQKRNFPTSTFNPRKRSEEPLTLRPKTPGQQFVPIEKAKPQHAVQQSFSPDDLSNLVQGMTVEHERFGRGKVIFLDGRPGEKKATVLFESAGQKQLLLKFAKLKIIQS
jgi:DNA helicase-2/ATP-dependent DNA helicase PcrA